MNIEAYLEAEVKNALRNIEYDVYKMIFGKFIRIPRMYSESQFYFAKRFLKNLNLVNIETLKKMKEQLEKELQQDMTQDNLFWYKSKFDLVERTIEFLEKPNSN